MNKIRIGIVGYGNLGKSVEVCIRNNEDMTLSGVFTRRNPGEIKLFTPGVRIFNIDDAQHMKDDFDVMILCGGSKSDLPVQGPVFAGMFNTVDGFDTHAKIPEYFKNVNEQAKQAGKVAIVSSGWDPGLFSINRIYADAVLPKGQTYTFWGRGVSQGHSDAIRRVKGVVDAKQYTIPIPEAIEAVKSGAMPNLTAGQRHRRECFVVAEEGEDKARIEHEIKTMEDYFVGYETIVHFITKEELDKNHKGLPHAGQVIRFANSGLNNENSNSIEYKVSMSSNPDFTANVLLAYARAAYRLNAEGVSGAKTVADIAPAYLSPLSQEEIIKLFI